MIVIVESCETEDGMAESGGDASLSFNLWTFLHFSLGADELLTESVTGHLKSRDRVFIALLLVFWSLLVGSLMISGSHTSNFARLGDCGSHIVFFVTSCSFDLSITRAHACVPTTTTAHGGCQEAATVQATSPLPDNPAFCHNTSMVQLWTTFSAFVDSGLVYFTANVKSTIAAKR